MSERSPDIAIRMGPRDRFLTFLLGSTDNDRSPSAAEWIAAVTLGLIAIATTAYAAREWWFHADAWDFMTGRSLADVESLLRPHAGHWQTPTTLLYLAIKSISGMDFWPAYFIPRLIGYAALSIWIWFVLRRRGTHPMAALASLAVVLWLAVSDWHDLSTIGNPIVLSAVLGTAMLSVAVPRNRTRYRLALFAMLMIALMSGGSGISLLLAAIATALMSPKRWSLWWPALAGAGTAYAAWYLVFRSATPSRAVSPNEILQVPVLALQMISNASAEVLRLGEGAVAETLRVDILGPAGAIAAIGLVVWLALRRRLDAFDLVLLLTLGAYLSMVIILRVAAGSALPTATRYAQNIILLAGPVILPRIAPATAPIRSIVVAVLIASLTLGNASMLGTRINFWERRAQASRLVVESAAALMNDGEPWLAGSSIDRPRAGMLTTTRLSELTDSGWDPPIAGTPEVVRSSRGNLRFDLRPGSALSGSPPTVEDGIVANGCIRVPDEQALSIEVEEQGAIQISIDGTTLEALWVDKYGIGQALYTFGRGFDSGGSLRLADPNNRASLSLTAEDGSFLEICGVLADR